jgi:uncharacterized protein (DUF433 family)
MSTGLTDSFCRGSGTASPWAPIGDSHAQDGFRASGSAVCRGVSGLTLGNIDDAIVPVYSLQRRFLMAALAERITVNPEQCGGRPCVRGLRIRVTDVLDLLASGLSPEQVLEELPDLEADDISACLRFASRRLDHPIVAA